MIKDIHQKLKAIRYCVALGMIPYMEVLVRFTSEIGDTPADITDIDVLGIKPSGMNAAQRVIFDCKTLNKMSPINRALWAAGLIQLTDSSEAFVILLKAAPEGHRLAGNSLKVRLFTEKMFEQFARNSSKDYSVANSYLENLSAWDSLSEIPSKWPYLEPIWSYLNSSGVLEIDGKQGLRGLMARCIKSEGEFDPSKPVHRALFKFVIMQFCLYISEMTRDFHNIFSNEMSKEEFEKFLRYYIWGGKSNYLIRKRLKVAVQSAQGVSKTDLEPFDFPAWDKFVELFRSFLEAPLLLGSVCLPLKDLAFREVSVASPELDRRLSMRLDANDRIRQFILAAASYIISATCIPKEFKDFLTKDMSL